MGLPFGQHHMPDIDINVMKADLSEAFRWLGRVYDQPEEFLEKFYLGIKDFCDEWGGNRF